MDSRKFSKRLEVAIAQAGLKKGAVAKKAGMTPRSLSRYLTGDRVPHETVLRSLAQTLHVTVDYLAGHSMTSGEPLADTPVANDGPTVYVPDAVALTGLDVEDRCTVVRLIAALRSGDAEIRRHLIGQLKIIESAIEARRQQPREEQKDVP